MSPTAFPAEACAEARAVLATPLFEVLRAVTSKKDTPAHLGRQGQKPKVVTLEHNTTLSDALETLARHRILGAPVLIQPDPLHADESCHDVHYDDSAGRERPVLLGFFDVGDALRELVRALPPEEEPEKVPVPPPRADESPQVVLPAKHGRNVLSWMRVLDAVERQVANAKLISLLGDDAELLYRADANAEGHTFVQTISEGFLDKKSANGAVHRIAIFDGTGEITQIMTMSDAVQYIASNVLSLKTLCKMSLQDLGFVGDERSGSTSTKQKLVAVPPTTPAIEAFAMMCASGVSGVGVLDDVGVLIANLSVSDVRCIQPEHFGVLGLPVAEFLALLHGTSYAGFSGVSPSSSSGPDSPGGSHQLHANPFFAKMNEGGFRKTGPYLVTVTSDTTFGDLLHVIVAQRVHRVYVVSDDKTPIGVVTLTDVLRMVRQLAE